MKDWVANCWNRFTGNLAAWTSSLPAEEPPRERADLHPVLLIHGIWDSDATMQPMRAVLAARGFEVFTLSLTPNDGSLPLEELAGQVRDYIGATFPPGGKIDLVGFSMGGLVCRYYLQRMGGAERVGRFVCISAPNHGSHLAFLSRKAGCRQMRPGSPFLRDLNGNLSALERVRLTTLWTPLDLTILPSYSSRLPMGAEIRKWVIAHPFMVLQRNTLQAVAEVLSRPLEA